MTSAAQTTDHDVKAYRIKRLLAVASDLLDAEAGVHALPCRDDRMKQVTTLQLFEASRDLLTVADEMMAELRAGKQEGQR